MVWLLLRTQCFFLFSIFILFFFFIFIGFVLYEFDSIQFSTSIELNSFLNIFNRRKFISLNYEFCLPCTESTHIPKMWEVDIWYFAFDVAFASFRIRFTSKSYFDDFIAKFEQFLVFRCHRCLLLWFVEFYWQWPITLRIQYL